MQDSVGKKPQRMVRKQILITVDQNRRLRAHAASTGIAETEIVRRGLDAALAEGLRQGDWRVGLRRLLELPPLDADFEQRMKENKKVQAAASSKRLERTRKRLAGD